MRTLGTYPIARQSNRILFPVLKHPNCFYFACQSAEYEILILILNPAWINAWSDADGLIPLLE